MKNSVKAKKIAVVGSGAREHAWAWKLSQSAQVREIILAPGNAGMRAFHPDWIFWPEPVTHPRDFARFADRCVIEKVDLVLIGPDDPLALGIVDVCRERGLRVFGPTQKAAQLEASKAFAKEVMTAANVPTARYYVTQSAKESEALLETLPWAECGWVLKADGLALGKGVIVCDTLSDARAALKKLSPISERLVIEEKLAGQEISWMAFCDGVQAVTFEAAADYKRAYDDHEGPNTGGMGAYSPVPGVTESLRERVEALVFRPVLEELRKRGNPFQGLLYAGLMIDFSHAPEPRINVIEFNARMGDPEGEVLLPRLESDLYPWLEACSEIGGIEKMLPGEKLRFVPDAAVYVVAAARGYPDAPEKGASIEGLKGAPAFFCAGVVEREGELRVNGGRVYGALGLAPTHAQAREAAYAGLNSTRFSGMHFRSDIAEFDRTPIVVLASGRGTNFAALAEAAWDGRLRAEIRALICDRPGAEVLVRARHAGVPAFCVEAPAGPRSARKRHAHEEKIRKLVSEFNPAYLVLAGYERLLTREFIEAYRDRNGDSRILNIHPSLLPQFPGMHAYRQAFSGGCRFTGVTVHRVEAEMDSGPVLAQAEFSIEDCASAEEVEKKGLPIEHALYVRALNQVFRQAKPSHRPVSPGKDPHHVGPN